MAKIDVLDILKVKKQSPLEFEFDNLWIPPMHFYLTQQDVDALRSIATSIRLSSNIQKKYKMIDDIMRPRGFKRFSAGTNRIVYSFSEDDRFLVKIAVDKVGMQDNPLEFQNQFLLKPYVAKMFYTSPCGTVGFAERVLPIKNKAEFREIAEDVFEILVNKILGQYVVEDVGTKFFMNWGIRFGHAPVLLDYPYIYKLDGNKLFCTKLVDPLTGQTCDGEIDYDCGFNHLVCTKCGKIYLACNLRDDSIENNIVIKGGSTMKVTITRGKEVLTSSIESEEVIKRPIPETQKAGVLKAEVINVPAPNRSGNRFGNQTKSKFTPTFNATITKGEDILAGGMKDRVETAEVATAINVKKPGSSKKNVKAPKQNVKLVSVDEVKEDKENNTVNIKVTVAATEEPVKEDVAESAEEETTNETVEETTADDYVESADEEIDDDPVDEIADKYGDLYDEDEPAPRKQPVRTRNTKKPSDGDEAPKKKTTTRIPKK